jgi:hypothetical protein
MSNILSWSCLGDLTVEGPIVLDGGVSGTIVQLGNNIAVGSNALAVVESEYNIAFGTDALRSLVTGSNITLGYNSAKSLVNGTNNIIIGTNSLQTNTTANNNVILGHNTVNNIIGNNNIVLGANNSAATNNIIIGNNNAVTVGNAIYISPGGMNPMPDSVYIDGLRENVTIYYLYFDPITKKVTYETLGALLNIGNLYATNPSNQFTLGNLILNSPNTGSERLYNFPNVGATANFVMNIGSQNIDGIKTFPVVNTNKIILGGTTTITSSTTGTYTIPATGSCLLTEGNQTGANLQFNSIVSNINFTNTVIQSAIQSSSKSFVIPYASSSDFMLTQGNQSIGIKTFTDQLAIPSLKFNNLTITASGTWTYTIPNVGAAADFLITSGNQTISGTKTFNSIVTSNLQIQNGFIANIVNNQTGTCTIPASTADFIMTTGVQDIYGIKTFTSLSNIGFGVYIGTNNYAGVRPLALTASRQYNIPNVSSSDFVVDNGNQTINGVKTFNSLTTSTLTLGSSVIQVSSANNNILTIPNVASCDFVTDTAVQTINGVKTFNNGIKITGNNAYYGNTISDGFGGNVAVGYNALSTGYQNSLNVAIGYNSDCVDSSIAIGPNAVSNSFSVVINASAVPITLPTNAGFYVKPIRQYASAYTLTYDTISSEIGYSTSFPSNIQKGVVYVTNFVGMFVNITYSSAFFSTPTLTFGIEANSGIISNINGVTTASSTTSGATVFINGTNTSGLTNANTRFSSLVLLSTGVPGLAYITSTQVVFRYATNALGTAWNTIEAAFSAANVSRSVSCALVGNSYPAMTFINNSNLLQYAVASNTGGTSWGFVNFTGLDGINHNLPNLIFANGKPGILYANITNSRIAYHYSSSSTTGSAANNWVSSLPFSTSLNFTLIFSLSASLPNFRPALAATMLYAGMYRLVYGYSGNPTGVGQYTIQLFLYESSVTSICRGASLYVVNGKPAISINISNTLYYYYSSTATGSNISDWTSITPSGSDVINGDTVLTVINGFPVISYINNSGNLIYLVSSTVSGSNASDWTAYTIGAANSAYPPSFTTLSNDIPAIAYSNNSTTLDYRYGYRAGINYLAI